MKARLAAEVAKAKTDRESGKKIERPKPTQPADQAGGGKTKGATMTGHSVGGGGGL